MAQAAATGTPVTLRRATLRDFEELLFIEEQAHTYPWPESTLHWCLDQPQMRCYLLQPAREILGFAIYECVLDEATLLNIAIHPELQGHGHGRKLLQASLGALDNNIVRVFLEVRVSNLPALALYQSEGFTEIGQRRNYYPTMAGREDARVFELNMADWRQRVSM